MQCIFCIFVGANDSAHDVEEAKQGHIFIKLPLPPGALYSLYQAPERFQSSYLSNKPGYYDTGDAGTYTMLRIV